MYNGRCITDQVVNNVQLISMYELNSVGLKYPISESRNLPND